jgi:hypothetical protein
MKSLAPGASAPRRLARIEQTREGESEVKTALYVANLDDAEDLYRRMLGLDEGERAASG